MRLLTCVKAVLQFRDYKPQPVTYRRVSEWLQQFDERDQDVAATLLNYCLLF